MKERKTSCREYRIVKRQKQRTYQRNCIHKLEQTFKENKSGMWKVLNVLSKCNTNSNMPSGDEFYNYFTSLSATEINPDFDYSYEERAIRFLQESVSPTLTTSVYSDECDIINRNFSVEEIVESISTLKNNKSPFLVLLKEIFFPLFGISLEILGN